MHPRPLPNPFDNHTSTPSWRPACVRAIGGWRLSAGLKLPGSSRQNLRQDKFRRTRETQTLCDGPKLSHDDVVVVVVVVAVAVGGGVGVVDAVDVVVVVVFDY